MAGAEPKLPIGANVPTQAGWAPIDTLRREIDQIRETFGDPWRPLGRGAFDLEPSSAREAGWSLAPAVDVAETEAEYEITAELPGLDRKDIEIRLADGVLTIRGEKRQGKDEKRKDYYLSERRYGSFTRSFVVPDVDAEKIEAGFAKGVLTVRLPKSVAEQQSRTIAVKAV